MKLFTNSKPKNPKAMKNTQLFSILTTAALSASSTATAAILARYEFPGGSAVKTSGELIGANATTGTGPTLNASGFVATSVSGTPTTLAAAITGEDYVAFTLSTTAAQTASFTTLTFDWWLNSPNSTATGESYSIFALADEDGNGFDTGDQLGVRTLGEGGTVGSGFNAHDTEADALSVSFTISSLADLAASESLEFRLYFVDNRAGVSSPGHRIDNFTVNGTTAAVPEPSALAILGVGVIGLLVRRRR